MNFKIQKALKIISNSLITAVAVLAFLLYGLKLFGLTPYAVLSGSMQSVYPTGSLIYVTSTDPATLQVNDVITFKTGGTVATHRIIELVKDQSGKETLFRTKGDENEIADGTLVRYDDVIGSPAFCIPFLGYAAAYIMSPSGKYIALCVAAALLLFEIAVSFLTDNKEKNKV